MDVGGEAERLVRSYKRDLYPQPGGGTSGPALAREARPPLIEVRILDLLIWSVEAGRERKE